MLKYAALAVVLAAPAAFAQSGATQSPPAPNSASSSPTPANSAPAGTLTMSPGSTANPNVSGAVGGNTGGAISGGGPSNAPGITGTVPVPAVK